MKKYYFYILTNRNKTVLYVGITNNLKRRITEHKEGINKKSFTARYNCHMLVYFESFDSASTAIQREKQIKAGPRKQKEQLINRENPNWDDLYDDLF